MPSVSGAILARYSTENQDEDSIEVQVERCRRYCDEHDIRVLDIYADYAVSGMKSTRPEYERMMADVRAGRISTIIIYDQSRMFRKMTAWFAFREELAALGASVISVTQPMIGGDLRDPATFISEATMAMFNQMWVLQTRQKVISKMRFMAQNGQHTGGKPPLGYDVADGKLVINESEAAVVRRIFSEYASGKSYHDIIDGLNRDGIRTKRGGSFGSNSLHDLLRNEKYIGVLTYGSTPHRADGSRNSHSHEAPSDLIRIPGAVPAIIDPETFASVQSRFRINHTAHSGRPASVRSYPLSGKVFCHQCGSSLAVYTSNRRYFYYDCTAKKRLHSCDLPPIRCDVLENMVASYLRTYIGNPNIKAEAMSTIQREAQSLVNSSASRLLALQEDLWDTDAKITRAVDAITSGAYSQALGNRLKSLEEHKTDLQLKIRDLKSSVDAARLPASRLEELFDRIMSASSSDLAATLSVVTRVEVAKDYILVYTIFDPDPSRYRFDPSDWASPDSLPLTLGDPSAAPRIIINAIGIMAAIPR